VFPHGCLLCSSIHSFTFMHLVEQVRCLTSAFIHSLMHLFIHLFIHSYIHASSRVGVLLVRSFIHSHSFIQRKPTSGHLLQAHIGSLALFGLCFRHWTTRLRSDCSPKWLSLTRCCYSVLTSCTLNFQVCHTHSRVRIIYPLVYQTRSINGSIAFSAQFTSSVDVSCALPLAVL
jgi:hypothetical protein